MSERILCRVLTGPTASGKSDLAMKLATENGWSILCMDSMQVYRHMYIGTDKPTLIDQQKVPHYLLDIREPTESFSVSEYIKESEKIIRQLKQGILFVGGTGLYLQAMMHPMGMGFVPADEELRNELNRLAEQPEGRESLHDWLTRIDPETAARLPVNDVRRIIRAIEVAEITGIPFSRQPERMIESPCEWRVVSTRLDRSLLYERINNRVDWMVDAGLREEVEGLLMEGVPENAQSMQALGYKEMIDCIRGRMGKKETVERIKTGTRHYAKRQMTFLRREPTVNYVDVMKKDAYDRIRKLLEK